MMKRLFRFLILLFSPVVIYGQVDTIFLSNGQIQEIGERVDGLKQGKWISYHENGKIESIGYYNKDKKEGEWLWYYDNGRLCSKEKYKKDLFKKGDFWDREGKQTTINEVMIKPEYPGGMDAFRKLIADNLRYPESAAKKGIHGTVFLEFNINSKGELVDLHVIRGVDPALDKEAIRVVNLSEKWKPGSHHGKLVTVSYTFPVVFVLQ
jgi:TonB family protein